MALETTVEKQEPVKSCMKSHSTFVGVVVVCAVLLAGVAAYIYVGWVGIVICIGILSYFAISEIGERWIIKSHTKPDNDGNQCRQCGYDLRGNLDAKTCPECGAVVVSRANAGTHSGGGGDGVGASPMYCVNENQVDQN